LSTTAPAKRQTLIDKINARLKPPSEDDLKRMREDGCESWGEWIASVADNNNMRISAAYAIFQMLGETEAFDGFVTSCEDAAGDEE
jgi:hypothetical protein